MEVCLKALGYRESGMESALVSRWRGLWGDGECGDVQNNPPWQYLTEGHHCKISFFSKKGKEAAPP